MELPLGATEDRICGTINIEKALQEGIKAYEPGLLVRSGSLSLSAPLANVPSTNPCMHHLGSSHISLRMGRTCATWAGRQASNLQAPVHASGPE